VVEKSLRCEVWQLRMRSRELLKYRADGGVAGYWKLDLNRLLGLGLFMNVSSLYRSDFPLYRENI